MLSFRTRLVACSTLLLLFALAAPPDGRAQPAADTLRTFLPEELGGLVRGELSMRGRSAVVATYHPADAADGAGPPFELFLFYGADHQQKGRDLLAQITDPASTATIDGHTVHVVEGSLKRGAFAFPGKMAVVGKAEADDEASWNAEAVQEQMMALLRTLDLERLAAFTLGAERSTSGRAAVSTEEAPATVDTSATEEAPAPAEAPARLTHYTADLSGVQVGFDYPEDWTVVNLHRKTRLARGVVAMRDPEAAAKMLEEGSSLSAGQGVRLLTPGNAGVAVSMIGDGPEPKAFLQDLVKQNPLKRAMQRAPRTVPIGTWDGRAHETRLDGVDADGRSVVWRALAFTKGGQLFLVSILQPADASETTREVIQTLLDTLDVTVQ